MPCCRSSQLRLAGVAGEHLPFEREDPGHVDVESGRLGPAVAVAPFQSIYVVEVGDPGQGEPAPIAGSRSSGSAR